LLQCAREARQLGERQGPAADAPDRLLDLAVDRRRQALGALADGMRLLREDAQHRDPLRSLQLQEERPLERGERELVDPQGALERMAAQALDEVRATEHDPRLGPAEELVAREADQVGARRERLARRWFRLDGR